MPNYLVRHRDTERLVGLYAVRSFAELMDLVGRTQDPGACDYAVVGANPRSDAAHFMPFPPAGRTIVANDP